MFLYYYVYLELPFATVEKRLLELLETGIDPIAAAAERETEALQVRLGFGRPEPRIGKRVRVTNAAPRRGPAETAVPITWETAVPVHVEATGVPRLFPKLDGDLVVAGLGPDMTQLAIRGSYEPPFGAVGRALDRTLFQRVAEAGLKGFLDRIAAAIETQENDEAVSLAPLGADSGRAAR